MSFIQVYYPVITAFRHPNLVHKVSCRVIPKYELLAAFDVFFYAQDICYYVSFIMILTNLTRRDDNKIFTYVI